MTTTDSGPVSEVEAGPSATPSLKKRLLKIALALVVVLGGAYLIWRQRDDLATAVQELSVGRFAVAGVLAVVGTMLIGQIWEIGRAHV